MYPLCEVITVCLAHTCTCSLHGLEGGIITLSGPRRKGPLMSSNDEVTTTLARAQRLLAGLSEAEKSAAAAKSYAKAAEAAA